MTARIGLEVFFVSNTCLLIVDELTEVIVGETFRGPNVNAISGWVLRVVDWIIVDGVTTGEILEDVAAIGGITVDGEIVDGSKNRWINNRLNNINSTVP